MLARIAARQRKLDEIVRLGLSSSYVRYGLVSVGALGADLAVFQMLLYLGVAAALAAALGYALGVAVHWFMSARLVFAGETHQRGSRERRRQKLLFALSALVGLTITTGIVAGGTELGLDPRLAKLVAIGASFQAVWLIRRLYVFAK